MRRHLQLLTAISVLSVAVAGCEAEDTSNEQQSQIAPVTQAAQTDSVIAYEVNGKTYTMKDVYQDSPERTFEIKSAIYTQATVTAYRRYFTEWATTEASKLGVSEEEALTRIADEKYSVDDIKKRIKQDTLPADIKPEQILQAKKQMLKEDIIKQGAESGAIKILYPQPEKPPVAPIPAVSQDEPTRYGPSLQDTKPLSEGCKGDDCELTIIKYFDYKCGFCKKSIPSVDAALEKYKGKIRFVARDLPIAEDRIEPAVASQCAHEQGKYWDMYKIIFENNQKISLDSLNSFATTIGLDMEKYQSCMQNAATLDPTKSEALKRVMESKAGAGAHGISGTPAFVINGQLISGYLPEAQFDDAISQILAIKAEKN